VNGLGRGRGIMSGNMNYWMIVTSRDNFEISRKMGFKLAGMKPKWEKAASSVRSGDRLVYYLTKEGNFVGILEAVGEYSVAKTGDEPWKPKKPGTWNDPIRKLNYPFRFKTKPILVFPEGQGVASAEFKDKLIYLKRWPAKYWKLGFQGNVHELEKTDFDLIEKELRARLG